ncbi:MAG: DNA/RNA nuclease SfsA, partial [Alphaproteobacteria bacterium]|nr:DNA/RNA nuclease SfsA [Alphaproteobacteria bacterium]
MKFKAPLLTGHLIRRYKRFMADIELTSGKIITAHCANSGAMLDLLEEGNKVWVSPAQNPDRKLKYTWELVETDGTMVGVNTSLPNGLAEEGILSGFFTDLQGYDSIKREVKYGQNSRIDILLSKEDGSKCFV